MIVLDASVAAKCYIEETHSERAEQLLFSSNHAFIAPSLISVEVSGALCRCARNKLLTLEEAIERCERWQDHLADGIVTLIPDEQLLPEAVRIATRLAHPLQDCLYLAAALQYKTYLMTADARLFERAERENLPVQLLMNYGIN